MLVNGCDCSIVLKTAHREIDVPYSDETLREAVSILQEEASIEGDGICKAIQKKSGVTGCVVTPLTIGTAPLHKTVFGRRYLLFVICYFAALLPAFPFHCLFWEVILPRR